MYLCIHIVLQKKKKLFILVSLLNVNVTIMFNLALVSFTWAFSLFSYQFPASNQLSWTFI